MPPFSPQNISLAQNGTSNSSVPVNGTCPDDIEGHHVSWQSAYWPVMACMLAVLLQETGRVLNAPYQISYALRASLGICAWDACMMIAKFVVLLAIGCGPLDAARHVWYDRFDVSDEDPEWAANLFKPGEKSRINTSAGGALDSVHIALADSDVHPAGNEDLNAETVCISSEGITGLSDKPPTISNATTTMFIIQPSHNAAAFGLPSPYQSLDETAATEPVRPLWPNAFATPPNYAVDVPGTTVDRTWRLSMISFMFGALPQAIKIFGMRGIPFTQALVGILITSFIVPELFRLLAGPVGQYRLRQLPVVLRVKHRFRSNFAFLPSLIISSAVITVPVISATFSLRLAEATAYHIKWEPLSLALGLFGMIFVPILITFGVYALHRILFVGCLSSLCRHLFGIQGTMEEFYAGICILANLVFWLTLYANYWDYEMLSPYKIGLGKGPTYKPGWAEYLG